MDEETPHQPPQQNKKILSNQRLDRFFSVTPRNKASTSVPIVQEEVLVEETQGPQPTSASIRLRDGDVTLQCDPGKRESITDFHPDDVERIRRTYLVKGPEQPILPEYPTTLISDSFWRLGGPSLAYSYARPARKRTFVKRLHAFFSLKYPSTTGLDGLESFQFDFGTLRTATDNFADSNKLGQGGFGPVFKGRLQNGQEVAIKMLSVTSRQGESEFRNEVMLLRKVRHKNLIRLLGFCVKGKQKLLIYEFAQNGSLDRFLFGAVNYPYLNWDHRYKIIRGVARGIHYLHEESPFQIFHCDIKPSNILLGAEFDPKISDFGFANLLNQRVSECSADKIVGTSGYLAPEYVMTGKLSVKIDVFSFGILLLEVIRGQKMMTYYFKDDNSEDNIENVWRNWREGTPLNFVDLTLRGDLNDGADVVRCIQFELDVVRCIQIGLLCIQKNAVERPTMGSVLLMLSSSSTTLPKPSEPAFLTRGSNDIYQESISDRETYMWNHYSGSEDSMTDLYPR